MQRSNILKLSPSSEELDEKIESLANQPMTASLISKPTVVGLTIVDGPKTADYMFYQGPSFTFFDSSKLAELVQRTKSNAAEESEVSKSPRPGQSLSQTDQ